jgi:hypothetical protein
MASQSPTTPIRPDRKRPKSRKELKQTIKELRLEQFRLAVDFEEMKGENEKLRQKTLFIAGTEGIGESSAEKLSRLLTVNVLKKTLDQKEREFQRQLSVREEEIKQLRENKLDLLETEEMERLEPCDLRCEAMLGTEETLEDESPSVALQTDLKQEGCTQMTQTVENREPRVPAEVQTTSPGNTHAESQTDSREKAERAIQTDPSLNKHKQPRLLQLSQTTMESTGSVLFSPRNKGSLTATAKGYRTLYEEKCGECETLRLLIHKQTPISQSYSELPVSFDTLLSPIRRRYVDSPISPADFTVEVKQTKLRAKEAALKLLNEELLKREKQVLALERTSGKSGSVRLRRLDER